MSDRPEWMGIPANQPVPPALCCKACGAPIDTTGWAVVNVPTIPADRLCSPCWLNALFDHEDCPTCGQPIPPPVGNAGSGTAVDQ